MQRNCYRCLSILTIYRCIVFVMKYHSEVDRLDKIEKTSFRVLQLLNFINKT